MGFCTHTVSLCVGCRYGLLCVTALCLFFSYTCVCFFFTCVGVCVVCMCALFCYAYVCLFRAYAGLLFRAHVVLFGWMHMHVVVHRKVGVCVVYADLDGVPYACMCCVSYGVLCSYVC